LRAPSWTSTPYTLQTSNSINTHTTHTYTHTILHRCTWCLRAPSWTSIPYTLQTSTQHTTHTHFYTGYRVNTLYAANKQFCQHTHNTHIHAHNSAQVYMVLACTIMDLDTLITANKQFYQHIHTLLHMLKDRHPIHSKHATLSTHTHTSAQVYMVFACTIMDLDTLYIAYNVPTIGICRAEQREKACQKLGIPAPSGAFDQGNPQLHGVGKVASFYFVGQIISYVGLAARRALYIYTVYDRVVGDFPAKHTVYTPYVYVLGQPLTTPYM